MTTFRVHYGTGKTMDVDADTPAEANIKARKALGNVIIHKTKVVKSK